MVEILAGIKILDLSRLLPGPFCTQMLGDLGAEVIKIEEVQGGDYTRWMQPRGKSDSGMFLALNRNKKSMKLNLRSEAGKAIFLKLVSTADVVLEQFRPGVMDRLGLGYEALKSINPRIIMCSITGYGQNGPYNEMAGHDINYLNLTGISEVTGNYNGKPISSGVQIADVGGGSLWAAFSILAALIAREKTGRGQYIDVAMTDCVFTFMSMLVGAYNFDKRSPSREDHFLNGASAWYNSYKTKDDRWIGLGMLEAKFWEGFCKAIRREDFIAQQFAPGKVQEEMIHELSALFLTKTADEWMHELQSLDICISKVNNLEEALDDPHFKERGMIVQMDHPLDGTIKSIGFPVKFSETPYSIKMAPPSFGEHTEEILLEMGFTGKEIEELSYEGIV